MRIVYKLEFRHQIFIICSWYDYLESSRNKIKGENTWEIRKERIIYLKYKYITLINSFPICGQQPVRAHSGGKGRFYGEQTINQFNNK